ncbi:cubilin [Trichonephila clavipes]|nr:cubilin [Trichonephila clavipes]
MIKAILQKIFGRAALNYEELITVLCDCERVINSRPLTYVSKFRIEYLGQLRQQSIKNYEDKPLSVGEIVQLEDNSKKRAYWSLARVLKLIPDDGRDGHIRLALIKTEHSEFLRPVQRWEDVLQLKHKHQLIRRLFTSLVSRPRMRFTRVAKGEKDLRVRKMAEIIGRLECGRTQLEVSEEHGISQSVISKLRQRFQDDGNVSRCYSIGRPRVTAPNEDRYIFGSYCQKKPTEHSIRPVLSALFSYRYDSIEADRVQALRDIGLYAHVSRFSLQSDSRQTLIWRVPGTRYHQENTIARHRYGGAGCLVWGGAILGSRMDLHVQSVTMTGHIYRDVILEQHARLFRGAMGAEFLFMDDNARPHRANIVDECLQSEDITLWIGQHTHWT